MRPKTLILVLAAAFLVVLLAQGPTSETAVKHADAGEPIEATRAPAFTTPNRLGSDRRVQPFALAEQSEAGRSEQDAQAGCGGEPLATAEPTEPSGADDDEETVGGDGLREDLSVYASEPTDQFWQWRRVLADEAPDTTWAEQLRSEVTRRVGDLVRSAASLHQIDCRETICQLYLHTDDALEAQAIFASMGETRIEIEHQQIAANVQVEGTPNGGTTHEVVVRRDRPAWMPPHVAGAARAHRMAAEANEAPE